MTLYHPVAVGSLVLPGNIFLAPVAGYSDRAFRSLCVEEGATLTCTELISSEALTRNGVNGGNTLLRQADNETYRAIQLFGASPEVMYRATAALAPYRPDIVDINAGCPVHKVVKTGSGSALMREPALLGRIVEAVVKASQEFLGGAPVTIKMRAGWDASSINYKDCARIAADAGAALVTLHPRTRSQGYAGTSTWQYLGDLVSCSSVPVAGSGDLWSPEDAERMLAGTGCAAVMFARGALGNPFIFSATRSLLVSGTVPPPDPAKRIGAGFRHLCLLAADRGEKSACLEMRKQFCAYTSGIAGGASLRDRLVHASSIQEYREILGLNEDQSAG
jgi:nifR3 family TIM-barrel protein